MNLLQYPVDLGYNKRDESTKEPDHTGEGMIIRGMTGGTVKG
jgi:hypothetical protein